MKKLLFLILLFCNTAMADAIKVINWQANKVYTIYASLNKATHIILPNNLITNPIIGNSKLWTVEGSQNHIFVKPNSVSKEGLETTLTLLTEDNSYEIILKNVENGDNCVKFVSGGEGEEVSSTIELVKQQVKEETMKFYRNMVYTRYEVKSGMFQQSDVVTDAWDDGRFTYIRVNHALPGVLTIKGSTGAMLDYKYEPDIKLYQITGLHQGMQLNYQGKQINVQRKDQTIVGA